MDNHPTAREVEALLAQVKAALQEAHFAARRMDELLRVSDPGARSADTIHRLRIAAGTLSAMIRAQLGGPVARP